MADIFVSYSRKDTARVEKLVRAIEAHGLSVWWDRSLEQGANFGAVIREEIAKAAAVVVCWSDSATESRWVREEADEANHQGKYVGSMIAPGRPALGFATLNNANLVTWEGDADDLQLLSLLAEVGRMMSRPDIAERAAARKSVLDDAEARRVAEEKARKTIEEQQRAAEARSKRLQEKRSLVLYHRLPLIVPAILALIGLAGVGWFVAYPDIHDNWMNWAAVIGFAIITAAIFVWAIVASNNRVERVLSDTNDETLRGRMAKDFIPYIPVVIGLLLTPLFFNPQNWWPLIVLCGLVGLGSRALKMLMERI